jgi:hypothetical protein
MKIKMNDFKEFKGYKFMVIDYSFFVEIYTSNQIELYKLHDKHLIFITSVSIYSINYINNAIIKNTINKLYK